MEMIEPMFRSGHIADIVIAVMVLEALGFAFAARARPRHWSLGVMLTGLLPGVFLVLALRAALVQASPPWIALALIAAFIAHLLDVRLRLSANDTR